MNCEKSIFFSFCAMALLLFISFLFPINNVQHHKFIVCRRERFTLAFNGSAQFCHVDSKFVNALKLNFPHSTCKCAAGAFHIFFRGKNSRYQIKRWKT